MYLNRVYFGSGAYGVEAASRRYFGKSARDVSLSEAALLAGLLKAPSRLSPARDPKAAEERAQLVLAAMREEKMIGDKELTMAMSAPATRAAAYWTGSENYVADRIMEELPGLIGEVRSDIIVDSTVDLTLQELAEKSIRRLVDENGEKLNVSQGALVSIDNSGAVRAMVGGHDYANSQFDRASEARRQPGSAFKPFVFMAALEQGRTPDSVRNDAPIKIGKWTPENYNGKYFGKVTLATALAKSLNSVAAQLTMEVGPEAVVEAAHRMGIESDLQANTSIALGTSEVTPLELTAAYVPFANGGYRPDVHFVKRITTTDGEVLYEIHRRQQSARRALRRRRHDECDDDRHGRDRHREEGRLRLAVGRQDRHQPEVARRLVHRLHGEPHHRRLVRQRRRRADEEGDRRRPAGAGLARIHGRRARRRAGGAAAGHLALGRQAAARSLAKPSAPLVEASPQVEITSQRQAESPDYALPQEEAPTSSIRRIVPPGDVGAPAPRRTNSILDILTGG